MRKSITSRSYLLLITCVYSAYSNYFTQLNHSSFMDTAVDLDLVDCTSLYASIEAFSLANTLSGLHKFLCSELSMREDAASAGDLPAASFCSSFFNSPQFPTLVRNCFSVMFFIFVCRVLSSLSDSRHARLRQDVCCYWRRS